jgi:hypothetical protein
MSTPFPVRDGDCPAATVCEALGNLSDSCLAGGRKSALASQNCMASLVIMDALQRGILKLEKVEEIVETQRKRIGFHPDMRAKPGEEPRS